MGRNATRSLLEMAGRLDWLSNRQPDGHSRYRQARLTWRGRPGSFSSRRLMSSPSSREQSVRFSPPESTCRALLLFSSPPTSSFNAPSIAWGPSQDIASRADDAEDKNKKVLSVTPGGFPFESRRGFADGRVTAASPRPRQDIPRDWSRKCDLKDQAAGRMVHKGHIDFESKTIASRACAKTDPLRDHTNTATGARHASNPSHSPKS